LDAASRCVLGFKRCQGKVRREIALVRLMPTSRTIREHPDVLSIAVDPCEDESPP
jgi:hypothetical protein